MFTTLQENLRKDYEELLPKETLSVKEAMRESTDRRIEQYENGEISEEEFCKIATDRATRRIKKDWEEAETKLENVCNAPDLQSVQIVIEFTKTRAVATVGVKDSNGGYYAYEGRSKAGGIDRASCAVAEALNQSYVVLKAMYQCKENGLHDTSCADDKDDNHKFLGYGSGYGNLPYFEQGVGLNAFWKIFFSLGFYDETIACTDSMEVYRLEKRREQK